MTDHTEMQIPDDVMKAANRCVDDNAGFDIRTVVARAILAERRRERERCARIADEFDAYSYSHEVASRIRSVDK